MITLSGGNYGWYVVNKTTKKATLSTENEVFNVETEEFETVVDTVEVPVTIQGDVITVDDRQYDTTRSPGTKVAEFIGMKN